MKDPQPLPCRLHPKDKITVYKTFDAEDWIVGCTHTSTCPVTGVSRNHAVMRWNELQKQSEKAKV